MAVDYYFGAGQLNDLEVFVNQLPMQNDEAFERLSIYLMETYRQEGQSSDAKRVRDALMSHRGNFAEVAHRVAYFDLAEQLGQLGAGELPASADSTQLVDLANAETAYAPVACAALRYYYPELSCGSNPTSASTAARPVNPPAVRLMDKVTLRAVPNPATETVTLTVNGQVPAGTRLELVALGTGRVVRTLPVTPEVMSIAVTTLAPGVYAGRLVHEGQVLSTCKVVVIH